MSYVRLGFNPQFYAAVHTPYGVVMNSYHLDMQMITVSNSAYDQNIALARIKYVIYEQFTKAGINTEMDLKNQKHIIRITEYCMYYLD